MADSGRLDELKRKFDENPRRYFAPLANEYRKAGDTDRAIELCRTYLPQQPSHMSGYIVYGQALFDAGRSDEAAAVFKQALALDPENVIAYRYLGDVARSKGDSAGAMRWYGKILELDPRNEEISAQITALATPAGRPAPRNERVAPPTIRPEPEYDASAVALSELVSQPDKHQPEIARQTAAPENRVQAEAAPAAPTPPQAPPQSQPEPFLVLEQSFEIISWPHEVQDQAEESSAPAIEPELDQSSDFSGDFTGDIGVENAHELEREAQSFADFLPDEPAPFAPVDTDVADFVDFEEPATGWHGGPSSDAVAGAEAPDSEPALEPELPPPESPMPESPFVTETMAELYVQQGLDDDALVIYRQLVLRRPDPRLNERIAELESRSAAARSSEPNPEIEAGMAGASGQEQPSQEQPSQDQPAPDGVGLPAASGETVREFFARIGAARAEAHVHLAAENEGGLADIFGSSAVNDADLSAAQSLAGAFGSTRPGSSESGG